MSIKIKNNKQIIISFFYYYSFLPVTELSIKCVILSGNSTGFDYLAARVMLLNFKMSCEKVFFLFYRLCFFRLWMLVYFQFTLSPSPGRRTLRTSVGTWRASHTSLSPRSLSSHHSFYAPGQRIEVPSPHLYVLRHLKGLVCFFYEFMQFICLNREEMTRVLMGPPTVCNTFAPLNAAFRRGRAHTWNIFFSDPLCLVYSFGKNSFRLRR